MWKLGDIKTLKFCFGNSQAAQFQFWHTLIETRHLSSTVLQCSSCPQQYGGIYPHPVKLCGWGVGGGFPSSLLYEVSLAQTTNRLVEGSSSSNRSSETGLVKLANELMVHCTNIRIRSHRQISFPPSLGNIRNESTGKPVFPSIDSWSTRPRFKTGQQETTRPMSYILYCILQIIVSVQKYDRSIQLGFGY
jgi:hypothetical protein